jgi:hypothetical protein
MGQRVVIERPRQVRKGVAPGSCDIGSPLRKLTRDTAIPDGVPLA